MKATSRFLPVSDVRSCESVKNKRGTTERLRLVLLFGNETLFLYHKLNKVVVNKLKVMLTEEAPKREVMEAKLKDWALQQQLLTWG